MIKSLIFLTGVLTISCEVYQKDHEMQKELSDDNSKRRISDYSDLLLYIDTSIVYGINDDGYKAFCEMFTCTEADSVVREIENPILALYAFYKLVFDECELNSDKAIEIIHLFEESEDTFRIWITSSTIGEVTIAQEAANSIYENNRFFLSIQQREYISKVRGF